MSQVDQWYIVRTNPQCENRAVRSLTEAGFDAYTPILRKPIIHHRTKKRIVREFPLMRGYIFLGMGGPQRHWGFVRKCDGVKSILGIDGRPLAIDTADVEAFRSRELAGEWDGEKKRKTRTHGFFKDQEVFIKNGPFTGFVAHVVDPRGLKAIRAVLSIFGRATEMTIPCDYLEAA